MICIVIPNYLAWHSRDVIRGFDHLDKVVAMSVNFLDENVCLQVWSNQDNLKLIYIDKVQTRKWELY